MSNKNSNQASNEMVDLMIEASEDSNFLRRKPIVNTPQPSPYKPLSVKDDIGLGNEEAKNESNKDFLI